MTIYFLHAEVLCERTLRVRALRIRKRAQSPSACAIRLAPARRPARLRTQRA
jgi:hypothetical protein